MFWHGGLGFHAKKPLSVFLLYAYIDSKSCGMGEATSNRGGLKMHDLVASEGLKWGHFG